ncbi:MAG TPA: PIN domain-containing protein [Gemmataceae bacterium]|nr:PIN domain-containing protein [Gemmataceae bacterium]
MTFADIPNGAAVFIDANIFVYHFLPHPVLGPACTDLLDQIEHKQLIGFTSAGVLSDLAHRLMTLEANQLKGWALTGIANRLKRHPPEIQQLNGYRLAQNEIAAIGVQILSISGALVSQAIDACRQFGLLMNDALVVAVMQQHGLTNLASHDADFTECLA